MGLCGAAQVLLVGVGGVCFSRPRLRLSCVLSPSRQSLRNLGQRTVFVARQPLKSRPRVSGILCMVIPKKGSQELKQQQMSAVAADFSTSPQNDTSTVVEHVVFMKVKDDPKTEEIFGELRALKSLDDVSHLCASKALKILGVNYTHVLHSRHPNKAALDAYAAHPSHQAVLKKLAPIIEDRLAVDWEALPVGLPIKGGHGAARIALIKFTDGVTEEEISQVFGLLSGLRHKFPFIRQISVGSNISPARAKGFNLGFLALFDNVEELQQLDGNSELHGELRKSRVSPFLQNFVVADIDSK